MVKHFYGNRSYVLLFLPIIIGIYLLCNYYTKYVVPVETIDLGLWGKLDFRNVYLDLSAPILILINAISINRVFNRNQFMERNNYLTSMLYVVLASFFAPFYFLDAISIVQTLFVIVLYQLFKLNQNEDGRRAVFNASLIYGIACTIYPILLLGLPLLFWTIWILRPFVLRESILTVVGVIIPLCYLGVYYAYMGYSVEAGIFRKLEGAFNYYDLIVIASAIALLSILTLNMLSVKLRISSIRLKKLFRMVFVLGLLCGGVTLFEYLVFHNINSFGMVVLPLMFFLPYGFGIKELRAAPVFVFYLIFIYSIGRFFIPMILS